MRNGIISFIIHFALALRNYSIPRTLILMLIILRSRIFRNLEEVKLNCTLQENENATTSMAPYLCEVRDIDISNIENIQLSLDFEFDSQDNFTLVGITPLAKRYMNNLEKVGNQFDFLLNSSVYILDHCIANKTQNKLNIQGEIQDTQLNYNSNDIVLQVNQDSENVTNLNINCDMNKIKINNYSLDCNVNKNFKGNLQSAISFIDQDILLLNFDSYNATITEEEENIEENIEQNGIYYRKKKNKNLGAGAIVAIIIASVIALGAVLATSYYFYRKYKNNNHTIVETSTMSALDKKSISIN